MPIEPLEPPTVLSSQRVVHLMTRTRHPTNDPNFTARGYGAHAFGPVIGLGATLKHEYANATPYPGPGYCPVQYGWRGRLARIYIDWLTVAHRYVPPSDHNQAVEWVARGAWARIRPSLNGGQKQWVRLNNPTGRYAVGLITAGPSLGGSLQERNFGRVTRLMTDRVLHPWAYVNPWSAETNNQVDSDIFALAAQNPADPNSDSRFDCIVASWWARVVPWDEALPLGDITANPILAVCAADPYVDRYLNGYALPPHSLLGSVCEAAVSSSDIVQLTTEWQQLSYATLTDAPIKHTVNLDLAGVSSTEFLTSLPPGYDSNVDPESPSPENLRQISTPLRVSSISSFIDISLPAQPVAGGTVVLAGAVWRFGDPATVISSVTMPGGSPMTLVQDETGADDNTFAFHAVASNITPGSPGPWTMRVNFTTTGSNKISAVAFEPSDMVAAPMDGYTHGDSPGASTSTGSGSTGTLGQADNLLVAVGGGLIDFTAPAAPWDTIEQMGISTGDPVEWTPGAIVAVRTVAATTAQSVTLAHTSGSGVVQLFALKRGTATAPPTTLETTFKDDSDMQQIKQNETSAARRRVIFDAVDATDGVTPETGLTWAAGEIRLSRNGGTEANHTGTVTELAGGTYLYEFTAAEVDTLGVLQLRTAKSGVRGARFRYQVVAFDPYSATNLGLSNVDVVLSTRLALSSYENSDALLAKAVWPGLTVLQALRGMAAMLFGRVTGAGTGQERFRSNDDTTDALIITNDTAGNRTSVTRNL